MTPIILTGGIDLRSARCWGLCAILFREILARRQLCRCRARLLARWVRRAGRRPQRIPHYPAAAAAANCHARHLFAFRGLAEAITHGADRFTNFPASFCFSARSAGSEYRRRRRFPLVAVEFGCWCIGQLLGVRFAPSVFRRRRALCGYSRRAPGRDGLCPGRDRVGVGGHHLHRAARPGKADAGTGYELFAITAVVLGGTSIFGGSVGAWHAARRGGDRGAQHGLVHARQPGEVAGMLTGALL